MKSHEHLQERVWKRKAQITGKNTRAAEAAKLLPGGKRILDVGCGNGGLVSYVTGAYQEIYGIDISSTALEKAKKGGMMVKKSDLGEEKIPHGSMYFDAVVCLDVIDYIRDPEYLIKEIGRVLRSGGIFVISFPNVRALSRIWSLIVRGRFPRTSGDTEGYDGGHVHYFTSKDIRHLLEKNGFRVEICKGMLPEGGRAGTTIRASSRILGNHLSREFVLHGTMIKAVKV